MTQVLRRCLLGGAVGLGVLAVPATAFAYGPSGAGITLSASSAVPGASVTVSAPSGSADSGSAATILLSGCTLANPEVLGTATVNSAGGLNPTTVTIPVATPPCTSYVISVGASVGGKPTIISSASFSVLAVPTTAAVSLTVQPPTATTGTLPFTGAPNLLVNIMAGLLTLGVGGGMILASRRHRGGHTLP